MGRRRVKGVKRVERRVRAGGAGGLEGGGEGGGVLVMGG